MKSKKELKAAYKQKKSIIGVFQVQNTVNHKILIEESTNITSKWNRHQTELKFGSHRNKALQNDWKKLGEEKFIFSIISELDFKEDENLDLNKELKVLKEMVLEELNIKAEMKY